MIAYLNIGSNQGDRQANIGKAVALIADAFPLCKITATPPIESKPWGFESSFSFVNVGVALHNFSGSPMCLLRALQKIEKLISPASHRKADGSYADRIIDIDIVAIEGNPVLGEASSVSLSTPSLQIPHPRAHLRDFVARAQEILKFE